MEAVTLTEDNRGLHRDLRLTGVMTLSPKEEDEHLSLALRQHDRRGRPVAQEPEDEDLELVGGRRGRRVKVEASYEMRQPNNTDGGYVREMFFNYVCLCAC